MLFRSLSIKSDTLLILDQKNKNDIQTHKDDVTNMKNATVILIAEYKETINTDLEKTQFAEFEKLMTQYRIARDELIEKAVLGDYKKAYELLPAADKIRDDMLMSLDKELKLDVATAKVDYDKSESSYKSASIQINIVIAIGLLVAIALGLTIGIAISRRLKKVLVVAQALGENDLSKTIDIDSNDEIGILSKALNKSVVNLKILISEISESATDISATSEELSATTEEISAKMDLVNESVRQDRKSVV